MGQLTTLRRLAVVNDLSERACCFVACANLGALSSLAHLELLRMELTFDGSVLPAALSLLRCLTSLRQVPRPPQGPDQHGTPSAGQCRLTRLQMQGQLPLLLLVGQWTPTEPTLYSSLVATANSTPAAPNPTPAPPFHAPRSCRRLSQVLWGAGPSLSPEMLLGRGAGGEGAEGAGALPLQHLDLSDFRLDLTAEQVGALLESYGKRRKQITQDEKHKQTLQSLDLAGHGLNEASCETLDCSLAFPTPSTFSPLGCQTN